VIENVRWESTAGGPLLRFKWDGREAVVHNDQRRHLTGYVCLGPADEWAHLPEVRLPARAHVPGTDETRIIGREAMVLHNATNYHEVVALFDEFRAAIVARTFEPGDRDA